MNIQEKLKKENWNYEIAEGEYYGYYSLTKHLLALAKESTNNSEESQAKIFNLLAQLCHLDFDANNKVSPYGDIQNIVADKVEWLTDIVDDIHEPLLKNRVADVLWLCHEHRNITYVHQVIDSATSMDLNQNFASQDILACFRRATILALGTNQKVKINELYTYLLLEIDNSTDERYFKLGIARVILDSGLNKNEEYILAKKMQQIAESKKTESHVKMTQAIDYLDFVIDSYHKSKKKQSKSEANNEKGLYLEVHADNRMLDSGLAACDFYKKALNAFQGVEQPFRENLKTEVSINRIRQKINDANLSGLNSMQMTETGIDVSELTEQAISRVTGTTNLSEALKRFINIVHEPDYQGMREQYHPSVIDFLGGSRAVSPVDGRTIAINKGIDINDPNSIEECKNDHAIKLLMTRINLTVESQVLPALDQINSEHVFTRDYLENLCEQAPIVPLNRQKLMGHALYAGFQKDYYTSTHVLCPQFEHMIRMILKDSGVKTSYIDSSNNIESENGLSTLMNSPELISLLGENLCFEIKTLFTDSKGFNLRNNIAHGLLDDAHAVTSGSVYAWFLILRMIIKSIENNVAHQI